MNVRVNEVWKLKNGNLALIKDNSNGNLAYSEFDFTELRYKSRFETSCESLHSLTTLSENNFYELEKWFPNRETLIDGILKFYVNELRKELSKEHFSDYILIADDIVKSNEITIQITDRMFKLSKIIESIVQMNTFISDL